MRRTLARYEVAKPKTINAHILVEGRLNSVSSNATNADAKTPNE